MARPLQGLLDDGRSGLVRAGASRTRTDALGAECGSAKRVRRRGTIVQGAPVGAEQEVPAAA